MDIKQEFQFSNANVDDGFIFSHLDLNPIRIGTTILIPADVNITIDEQPIPFGT